MAMVMVMVMVVVVVTQAMAMVLVTRLHARASSVMCMGAPSNLEATLLELAAGNTWCAWHIMAGRVANGNTGKGTTRKQTRQSNTKGERKARVEEQDDTRESHAAGRSSSCHAAGRG